MTVSELLERIDSHELTEWMIYYKIEQTPEEKKEDPKDLSKKLMETFAGIKR